MDAYNYNVKCKDFAEAKEFVLDAFVTVIDRLTYLCEQIRAAEEFDDLDLAWEQLIEEIESEDRPPRIPRRSWSRRVNAKTRR